MKPWVARNAQGNVIGRYATDVEAANATSNLIYVDIKYEPRAKRKTGRKFP